MKILFIIAAWLFPLITVAQKQKKEQPTMQQLSQSYQFKEMAARLEADIVIARRRRQPIDLLEKQLAEAQHLAIMMESTQKVVFIDSIVTTLDNMFNTMLIGGESGTLTTYSRAFGQKDTLGCTVYQSQLGNLTIFAKPVEGTSRLYSSNAGGSWMAAEPLSGLPHSDYCQNFPFMLQDGITLYYGAINPEGLGGYDIYISRYDADEKTFLEPENIGMPFNSPANDYMLAIDEFNNLGYLVTDRRQPEGYVCIYTFIPPTTHTNLCDMGINGLKLQQLAALTSIALTQEGATDEIYAARKRLQSLAKAETATTHYDFTFIINNATIYHFQHEFKNKQARAMIPEWQKLQQEVAESKLQLDATRQLYAKASSERKNTMRQQLLTMETAYGQTIERLRNQEKLIRRLENKQ